GEGFFVTGGQSKMVNNVSWADSSFFQIFTFPFIIGNPALALREPFTAVLTKSTAEKLFGDADPMGKTIRYNGKNDYLVTGIVEDPPQNSHIRFNALLSFASLYEMENYYLGWDGGWSYYTYITVPENVDWEQLNKKLPAFMEKNINYKYKTHGIELKLLFDPLEKVYLHSTAQGSFQTSGNPQNLLVFSAVALFILLIACINFMNLSTARYSNRTLEVGMRKVLGANRNMLIRQFLGESMLISTISLMIALILVEIIIPEFSYLIDTPLNLYHHSGFNLVLVIIIIAIATGFLAGAYPAFFMVSFAPLKAIKGNMVSISRGKVFRNILVVLQFFIATVLIIATITVFRQLNFINSKPLGYDKSNIIMLDLNGKTSKESYQTLKHEIKRLPYVEAAGASSDIPVWGFTQNGYIPEGLENPIMIHVLDADVEFLETLGIRFSAGRNFSAESVPDHNSFLINQALADKLGWDDPVGKTINRDGDHPVIGVVNDFHYAPLNYSIEPLIITMQPYGGFNYLSVRIRPGYHADAIGDIEKIWNNLFPDEPYVYSFLDTVITQSYGKDQRFGKLFMYFAIFAIFLACLGLFGLASFLTEQRRKEIGIRKTFGAGTGNVIWWLGRDFSRLVLIGNLIGWPVAWYIMHRWLDNYAYKASLSWWIFGLTLVLSQLVAVGTVIWQSWKAARMNPVDAIKYE
nr:ABC transporter permease [Bacteroidota bacterium]